jgi:hypothetical protein
MANQPNQPNQPIPLNYQGAGAGETLNEANAFTARRRGNMQGTALANGDFLYRVFPTRERAFFIKLDSGTDAAIGFTFGLIGLAIQKMMTKNKRQAQVAARLASFQGQRPSLLLSQDKANHVLLRKDMQQPTLLPPSFWQGGKFGRFVFKDAKGKKRIFFFEDTDNFRAALKCLHDVFGDELTIRAEFDGTRNKIVKLKTNG